MAKKEKENKNAMGKRENAAPSQGTPAPRENANKSEKKLSRKERKQQKKARIKQQLALEKQLVAEGKIPARNKYRARSFFGRAAAFCLVFLFGIVSTVGAFLGFGAFAPAKDVFGLIGFDYKNFISEEYASDGILALVRGILSDINNDTFDSLGSIGKYTPILDNYLEKLNTSLTDLGVHVDLETLKSTKFDALGDYFQNDVMGNIVLGEVMGVKPTGDAMLIGLCYGEEGIDYTVENDKFVMLDGHKATTIGDLMDSPTDIISTMRLGTLMGLNKNVTEASLNDNAMMYALCYGKRDEDYEVRNGNIVVLTNNAGGATTPSGTAPGPQYVHSFPTTLDALMNHSNAVIESLELGSMLGLDGSDIDTNGVMYSLAYGSRGVDWEYTDKKIVMLDGHDDKYPTKMGDFINSSNSLIDGMEIETLLSIKPDSNSLMHYLAYGTEMPKGKEPYTQDSVTHKYHDADGNLVDAHGYLLDAEGGYLTEEVNETAGTGGSAQTATRKQYKDGARFVYEYAANGTVTGIKMLPDPNDPQGKPYAKKNVSDLTDGDAELVEGMKIGDAMEIGENSSAIMQAMKDWTIGDLKNQDKIESLTIGDVLGEEGMTSKIMQALKDKSLADMKDQDTIESLTLGDVLDPGDESSGIMKAMENWRLDDLSNQYRIDRLKISNVITIDDGSSALMQAMKDWRIGDLTKQEKIDSLTLGDVLVIDETEGILAALKDCPIGSMQTRIDTLTLTDILGDDEVEGNKLLMHLADSTVKTLASDMEALSIGEVFADELFSFMEIKEGKTYQDLYEQYYEAHNNENSQGNAGYLPQKYTVGGEAIKASQVETYYVVTDSSSDSVIEVVLGYYTKSGEQYTVVPSGTVVKKEASSYFFETEIELTPVYGYSVVNYAQSKLDDLPAGDEVIEEGGKLYYKTGGAQYEIKDDGYSLYYLIPADGEGDDTRVDLDRHVSGYKIGDGDTMPLDKGKIEYNGTQYDVHHKKAVKVGDNVTDAYDYITVRTEVFERFAEDSEATTTYSREDTTERYRYTPAGSNDPVQLDRYLEGVWFMLLAHEEEPSEGEAVGTFTYNVSKPILEMDGLVTDIGSSITSIPLWKLYFHGMLQEDPFVDLSTVFRDGFDLGDGRGTVINLNECTVTDTIKLLQATIDRLSAIPHL